MFDIIDLKLENVEVLRTLENGSRILGMRGRFWGTYDAPVGCQLIQTRDDSGSDVRDWGIGEDAEAAPFDARDVPTTGTALIRGVASSTGVDFYGTEMTLNALESQARQMTEGRGVAYAPTHPEREWHQVIGRTVRATVDKVDSIPTAFDDSEDAYVLTVESEIDLSNPRGRDLVIALGRGDQIGQSIGAWFTSVFIQENRDGQIERIFIDDLDMDHLAGTRTPANSESDALKLVSQLRTAIRSTLSARSTAPEVAPETDETTGVEGLAVEVEVEELTEGEPADARTVLPFADLPTADIDEAWSFSAEDAAEVLGDDNWERFARAHVYRDSEADPETRAAYKLPIAKMFGGTLRVVFRGVVAAMAAVNGARGGVDIPSGEKRGAYNHLARYYEKFDREPPEFEGSVTEPDGRDQPVEEEAEASNISEASAEEPTSDEEIEMDQNELRAMLAAVVGEQLADVKTQLTDLGERVSGVEQRGAPAAEDKNVQASTEDTRAAETRAADARVAELEAQLEAERRARAVDAAAVDRLVSGASRSALAYSHEDRAVANAIADGDFGPLIERAKAQGTVPTLVRACDPSTRAGKVLAKVRDAFENPDQKITNQDIREALKVAFRAFEADGGFRKPANPWA